MSPTYGRPEQGCWKIGRRLTSSHVAAVILWRERSCRSRGLQHPGGNPEINPDDGSHSSPDSDDNWTEYRYVTALVAGIFALQLAVNTPVSPSQSPDS